jgi:hypothetical protein
MRNPLLAGGLVLAALLPILVLADVGPPAHLLITEQESGEYLVRWRVPTALPPRAVPTPDLPETCEPAGDISVDNLAGAWLFTQDWRCETGLAGQAVGLDYPFADLALTTVVRVDLLSGDRFAHVISAGEGAWQLPEGTAAPDRVLAARKAVISGASHVLASWVHLAFLVVVGLAGAGRSSTTIRLVSAFTLGQLGGAVGAALIGRGLAAAPAEFGLAVAVVLLAREALRPEGERRRLPELALLAGGIHGLGLAALLSGTPIGSDASLASRILAVLGIDALHLVGAVAATALLRVLFRWSGGLRRGVTYAAGAAAMALATGLAFGGGAGEVGAATGGLDAPVESAASATSQMAGSQRLAPSSPNAAVQSFLAVEPFEIRHEVMLRIAAMENELALSDAATIDVSSQPELLQQLADLVLSSTQLEVDGAAPEAVVRRADFMTVDPTGALPRANPVPEEVREAVVGIVVAYPTPGMAERASLTWSRFPGIDGAVAATVIDPETVESQVLTAAQPAVAWENNLLEDPIPAVEEIPVEPARLPVPILSLPLILLAVAFLVAGLRGHKLIGMRPSASVAAARVLLALGLLVGPVVQTAVALPGSAGRTPSERQARRILAGLLPNIYRALEYREEGAIYDRLAVSVTGETLTDVYLEHSRALELEERGGAQARVEAVEVLEAADVESRGDGFAVRSMWTVGGMVTHFGHRHFRQNRYDAVIEIVPVDEVWRIRSIEVLDQERVR